MALNAALISSTLVSSSLAGPQTHVSQLGPKSNLRLKSCSAKSYLRFNKKQGSTLIIKAAEQSAAAATATSTTTTDGILEVTQDTFWPTVEAAGEKLVVLDMYTQWCGPCKLLYPKIVELSGKYSDVVFLKLDCNQENKALAKQLGIKVVPTFKLFKKKEQIAEVKGAKFEELVQNIEKARSS